MTPIRMKSVVIALLALSSPANACDTILAHITSYHTDRELITDVNEVNPGIGCRQYDSAGVQGLDWEFGAYHNSFGYPTVYHLFDVVADSGFGVYAGIASGYPDQPTELFGVEGLVAIGGAVYQGDTITIRATPSYNNQTETVGAVLSLSVNLWSGK